MMAVHPNLKLIKDVWIPLMKLGNLKEVINSAKETQLDAKESLLCIISISQLLYEDIKKGNIFKGSPEDITRLIKLISYEPISDEYKYLNSLYHVINFMYEKSHFDHAITLLYIILEFKKNSNVFKNDAKTLYESFLTLMACSISKVAKVTSSKETRSSQSTISVLLSILLDFLEENNSLANGAFYLNVVFKVMHHFKKVDQKAAVRVTTSSMITFFKVGGIQDADVCLPLVLKIYTDVFILQQALSGYISALFAIELLLDQARRIFSADEHHRECFELLCNVTSIFSSSKTEINVQEKIENNNKILASLKKSEGEMNVSRMLVTCDLLTTLLINSDSSKEQRIPFIPNTSFEPTLLMILNLQDVYKDCVDDKLTIPSTQNQIQCLSDVLSWISERGSSDKELLERCVKTVVEIQVRLFKLLQQLSSSSTDLKKVDTYTQIVLIRCANLIRIYHITGLSNEVITLAKTVCKFICSLPRETFEKPQFQHSAELCFTCIVSSLGPLQLDKVLECLTAWILIVPHGNKKAFRLWADMKHNAICAGRKENLNITIWTVIDKHKSIMKKEWLPCHLSSVEVARLLVEELKVYFENRSLRGQPVISAIEALQSLSGIDCLTQVKGLVVAMDVASGNHEFHKESLSYYNTSKQLATVLKREKKNYDPVEFNFCMGDLLYSQLRCQLRQMRQECQTEMVRLQMVYIPPQENELPESRPDPNDTCDINAKYSNLCLTKQRGFMDTMDSALRHWEFAYDLLKEVKDCSNYDIRVTLESLADAGHLLKLYSDEVKQALVWKILYNMASLVQDSRMIITAVGEMLNVYGEIEQEWIENANHLLEKTEIDPKVRRAFQLNSALNCLNNKNQIKEGLKILSSMDLDIQKPVLQNCQFLSVIGEYQMMRDWQKYNHCFSATPTYHLSLHKALGYLLYISNWFQWGSFGECSQLHWQLLRVSRLYGEANWIMEQPREARHYLKSILPLAQKLCLPLRTIELLVILAWVDLTTGLVDDCAVKLEGLEDLLELSTSPIAYKQAAGSPSSNRLSMVSPPKYLSHPVSCGCLPCVTPEYRRLVLETLTLRATFCSALGKKQEAQQCFEVAMQVEKGLHNLDREGVRLTCARMWMRYANMCSCESGVADALDANGKALELLASVRDPNTIQHAIEQKAHLQCISLQLHLQPIKPLISLEIEKAESPKVQTPKTLRKPTIYTPGKMPLSCKNDNITPVTPFARPVRPFKLPSSGGEENTPPVNTKKSKKKLKPLPKFVTETPQSAPRPIKASITPFVIVDDDGKPVGMSCSKSCLTGKKAILNNPSEGSEQTSRPTKKKLFPDMAELASSLENEDCQSARKNKCKGENVVSKLPKTTMSTSSLQDDEDEIVRRSKRGGVKTYSKSKLPIRKDKPQETLKPATKRETVNKQTSKGVFAFDQMKNAIDNVTKETTIRTRKKNDSSKFSSSVELLKKPSDFRSRLPPRKANGETGGLAMSNSDHESDCDLIEGTPSPVPIQSFQKPPIRVRPIRATRSSKN